MSKIYKITYFEEHLRTIASAFIFEFAVEMIDSLTHDELIFLIASIRLLANIYLIKVINRNTRESYEIYSKLTIKTPERCQ